MKNMLIVEKPKQRNRAKPIPESLIYEIMDGRPLYYEGYKDVLANKKQVKKLWRQVVYNHLSFNTY